MVETATGLVLRTRPLTETSLIVQWLTPELGRLATVAKGARRLKSPFLGKLDLFYLADFSFSRSRRSELHTLREVKLRHTHAALRQELACLQQASYATALIEQTTETETPLPEIFRLLASLLERLPHQCPQPQTVFAFELRLLEELGLKPDLSQASLTTGARNILRALAESDWQTISHLKLSAAQARECSEFIHEFLLFHLGRVPASRASAVQV